MLIYLKARSVGEAKIVWSTGATEYEPYIVNGAQLEDLGRRIRAKLGDLLKLYPLAADDREQRLILIRQIATLGNSIWSELIQRYKASRGTAAEVEDWLKSIPNAQIVVNTDSKLMIPWSLVFSSDEVKIDQASEEELLPNFWGWRHQLVTLFSGLRPSVVGIESYTCGAKQISVLNRELVDPVFDLFDQPERKVIENILGSPAGSCFNVDTLRRRFSEAAGEHLVLSFFVHSDGKELVIGTGTSETITIDAFKRTFYRRAPFQAVVLVILNGCETSVGELDEGFLEATSMPGFCGFLGTEAVIPNVLMVRFGSALLTLLLEEGKTVRQAMELLRKQYAPWSLAYSCFASPELRLARGPAETTTAAAA